MWLKRGAAEIMLDAQFDSDERPERMDPARRAAHADTVFYVGCADVDEAHRELKRRGDPADPPKRAPHDLKLFGCTDPDGDTAVLREATQE